MAFKPFGLARFKNVIFLFTWRISIRSVPFHNQKSECCLSVSSFLRTRDVMSSNSVLASSLPGSVMSNVFLRVDYMTHAYVISRCQPSYDYGSCFLFLVFEQSFREDLHIRRARRLKLKGNTCFFLRRQSSRLNFSKKGTRLSYLVDERGAFARNKAIS